MFVPLLFGLPLVPGFPLRRLAEAAPRIGLDTDDNGLIDSYEIAAWSLPMQETWRWGGVKNGCGANRFGSVFWEVCVGCCCLVCVCLFVKMLFLK